ncbi:hypothetical protein [Microbacterium sp. MTN4-26]|uniref:hypothetical protein n=1 Tax=unclassified Microbacterium TaxID=2609290 RepID=UPI0036F2F328
MAPAPAALVSPWATTDSLEKAIVGDVFGEIPAEVITPEIALRVPEVSRALQAHQALVAPLAFERFTGGTKDATQPYWVTNSAYPGMSPWLRWKGVVRDLFLHGYALLGAELDDATDLPRDVVHIPYQFWTIDSAGSITVDDASVPLQYRQRLILIPLGSNGLLVDGIDSVRQARKLELARQSRLDAPPVGTELHITDARFDEMTKAEKRDLAKSYAEGRQNGSVSVTPSYIDVKERGTSGQLDLFETGMNSLRLQLAMHAAVPASFLEAGKEGGSAGAMTYSNENDRHSELWTFGSAAFAYAITARLSLDDVVGPDSEVRADLAHFSVPAPSAIDPEAGDAPGREVTP